MVYHNQLHEATCISKGVHPHHVLLLDMVCHFFIVFDSRRTDQLKVLGKLLVDYTQI